MKTQILTKNNNVLHLTPVNPGAIQPTLYKVTGHAIPTVKIPADEVVKRFYHFEDKVVEKETSYYLTIIAKDNAHIELSADVRHGNKGFRANRYELVNPANQKRQWDEWPMFFETLDQAIELFAHPVESGAYIDGEKAARLRF